MPVPPPVKFAPLGWRIILSDCVYATTNVLTPIARELSVKAQVEDVQIHSPLIGSQNGVEQLAGTATIFSAWRTTVKRNRPTTEASLLAIRGILRRVGVIGHGLLLGAAILRRQRVSEASAADVAQRTQVENGASLNGHFSTRPASLVGIPLQILAVTSGVEHFKEASVSS